MTIADLPFIHLYSSIMKIFVFNIFCLLIFSIKGYGQFFLPLSDPPDRITKKSFGNYITPATSPVQPEKFSGYHTGVDFEILPGEENVDVAVKAISDGVVLQKRFASGYGGVIVVSSILDNQPVTIVYGHLRLPSIAAEAGDTIRTGATIGFLGNGYSKETDGERKHLHLSIHKGTEVNIRGYVKSKEMLNDWIDPCRFVCQ